MNARMKRQTQSRCIGDHVEEGRRGKKEVIFKECMPRRCKFLL